MHGKSEEGFVRLKKKPVSGQGSLAPEIQSFFFMESHELATNAESAGKG